MESIVPNIPVSVMQAFAFRERSSALMTERVEVTARFDDGEQSGDVLLVGANKAQTAVLVMLPGMSEYLDVPADHLFVDEATSVYLQKCVNVWNVRMGLATVPGLRTRYQCGSYRATGGAS